MRAREIVNELSSHDITAKARNILQNDVAEDDSAQLSIFDITKDYEDKKLHNIVDQIKEVDLNNMTPMKALEFLYDLQKKSKE